MEGMRRIEEGKQGKNLQSKKGIKKQRKLWCKQDRKQAGKGVTM